MKNTKELIKEKELIINSLQKKSLKKKNQKKKTKKTIEEKKYNNLKELLEDMNKEKGGKLLKEKTEKKEEEKEELLIKDFISTDNISISGTTIASSNHDPTEKYSRRKTFELKLEYNYILKNIFGINEEEELDENNKRKSSPVYEYFISTEEFLRKKENEGMDYIKSKNFVNKSKIIINPKKEETKDKKETNNSINNSDPNTKKENKKNKFNIEFDLYEDNMNYPVYNYMGYYNYNYNNIYEEPKQGNDIQNIIINNIKTNFYSSKFPSKKSHKNKKGKNKQKKENNNIENKSEKREGDWTCIYCFNLNYFFRKTCNRCNAPKQN